MRDVIGTGMEDLDGQFKREGILPGSVITVSSEPVSVGEVLSYNLLAGRETIFASVGNIAESTKDLVEDAGELDSDSIDYFELEPAADPGELDILEELSGLSDSANVFVGPTNLLEGQWTHEKYWDFLTSLKSAVVDADGLCILLSLESEPNPEYRWMTHRFSDHVFTILHQVQNSGVETHFILEKVHPRQSLVDADNRAFYLTEGVDLQINTSRNIQA